MIIEWNGEGRLYFKNNIKIYRGKEEQKHGRENKKERKKKKNKKKTREEPKRKK